MANTIAYEYPITGAGPITAAQARPHQQMSFLVTGDGAATTFTLTHNWGIASTGAGGSNANGFPEFTVEGVSGGAPPILECAAPAGKLTNTIVFTQVAATSAVFRVRLKRPWSPEL